MSTSLGFRVWFVGFRAERLFINVVSALYIGGYPLDFILNPALVSLCQILKSGHHGGHSSENRIPGIELSACRHVSITDRIESTCFQGNEDRKQCTLYFHFEMHAYAPVKKVMWELRKHANGGLRREDNQTVENKCDSSDRKGIQQAFLERHHVCPSSDSRHGLVLRTDARFFNTLASHREMREETGEMGGARAKEGGGGTCNHA